MTEPRKIVMKLSSHKKWDELVTATYFSKTHAMRIDNGTMTTLGVDHEGNLALELTWWTPERAIAYQVHRPATLREALALGGFDPDTIAVVLARNADS